MAVLLPSRPALDLMVAELCRNRALGDRPCEAVVDPAGQGVVLAVGDERMELAVGGRPCTALVVLGHASDGTVAAPRLSATGAARLTAAERAATTSDVVVLSGRGKLEVAAPEASLMAASWTAPPVPTLLEVAARTTAENALLSAALLRHLQPLERVTVVTSWWHVPRARVLFEWALRQWSAELELLPAPDPAVTARRLADEVRYFTHIPRNVRDARELLRSRPLARPARSR